MTHHLPASIGWEELALNLYGNTQDLNRIVSDIRALQSCGCALQPAAVFSQDPSWPIREHWNLLHLIGVVPFRFKTSTFNAPIRIVICHGYPRLAPLAFVVPVEGMAISKNHRHVDETGKCYLPYLHTWSPASNLVQLVSALSAAFDNNPPVFKVQNPVAPKVYATPVVAQPAPSHFTPQTLPPISRPNPAPAPAPAQDNEADKRECIRKIEGRAISQYMTWRLRADEELSKQKVLQRELDIKNKELDFVINRLSITQAELVKANAEFDQFAHSYEEQAQRSLEHPPQAKTIDQLVVASDVRSEQLLELVADDRAIMDTVYWLDKALEQGSIDLAVWLKTVRNITKEQYKKRALIRKIVLSNLDLATPRLSQ
eukprot:c12993_g1_i1.p1 GENE.c12993_g1_i1~~c12993_g1_i1.p1  ORF type:complete len:372 (+),score=99.93 c12993_g1_i1:737-1852(+)